MFTWLRNVIFWLLLKEFTAENHFLSSLPYIVFKIKLKDGQFDHHGGQVQWTSRSVQSS